MMIKLNEIKDRLGEKVYVEQKSCYNQIKGIYILAGLQQTIELDKNNRPVWTNQIQVKECGTNCSIWLSAKNTTITFLSSIKEDNPEAEDIPKSKSISEIQAETIAKIQAACQ